MFLRLDLIQSNQARTGRLSTWSPMTTRIDLLLDQFPQIDHFYELHRVPETPKPGGKSAIGADSAGCRRPDAGLVNTKASAA
jgi:hypothetical protein